MGITHNKSDQVDRPNLSQQKFTNQQVKLYTGAKSSYKKKVKIEPLQKTINGSTVSTISKSKC